MIAVYRGVFVDDCPIWSGELISFASCFTSDAVALENGI